MRFFVGVVVGIVIGRPVMDLANDHLTPPVKRKIASSMVRVTDRINNYFNNQLFGLEEG